MNKSLIELKQWNAAVVEADEMLKVSRKERVLIFYRKNKLGFLLLPSTELSTINSVDSSEETSANSNKRRKVSNNPKSQVSCKKANYLHGYQFEDSSINDDNNEEDKKSYSGPPVLLPNSKQKLPKRGLRRDLE